MTLFCERDGQIVFDGRFSEEDKNRLIASAKAHARTQAEALALRYRAQVEQSAHSTLKLMTKPLGFAELEVRFHDMPQVSSDIAMAANAPLPPMR